jgi:hypothetical protein
VLLDEVVAKAGSAPDAAKDVPLDPPLQKVVRAWREVASFMEPAVRDSLQQHEPPLFSAKTSAPLTAPNAAI